MDRKKTIFNWSGGKDSAIALHQLLQNPEYSVERLLTSVNSAHDRISMHGVRRELLKLQAERIGIPLTILSLPEQPDMNEYNQLMAEKMNSLKEEGFTHSVYGDIFLEDLQTYRINQMKSLGFEAAFPIWKKDTTKLIRQFIDDGFKAITVCIKSDLLDKRFVGRVIDHDFVNDLPENVDPCGENGEFHTFVYDAPFYSSPIPFNKGEIIYREYDAPKSDDGHSKESDLSKMGFWFCDLGIGGLVD